MQKNFPKIDRGKRAAVAGRTGSGKSVMGCWLLWQSPGQWVILNPKNTAAYDNLPHSVRVDGLNIESVLGALESVDENGNAQYRFVNLVPSIDENSWQEMDEFVLSLHQSVENVGLCCDELYALHNNGRAGRGLIAWLTRGREPKQSFIGMTQRPAWISRFVFSECDYLVAMNLNLKDDRAKMVDISGNIQMGEPVEPYYWRWYDVGNDDIRYFAPVPI